jgi:hypothetical protein
MVSYRVEVMNVKTIRNDPKTDQPLALAVACCNMFSIPVFIIPGIEVPFRGLGLKHDFGDSK